MERAKAVAIIRSLANGVDPQTGAALTADSPCQQPDTIRALFAAAQALEETGIRHSFKPERRLETAGEPHWDEEEDLRLCRSFGAGMDIGALAAQHGCTADEVQVRLEALGQVLSSSRERARQDAAPAVGPDGFFVFRRPSADTKAADTKAALAGPVS